MYFVVHLSIITCTFYFRIIPGLTGPSVVYSEKTHQYLINLKQMK